jgi:hypothetical protein
LQSILRKRKWGGGNEDITSVTERRERGKENKAGGERMRKGIGGAEERGKEDGDTEDSGYVDGALG